MANAANKKRLHITKTTRFEVFKRDAFICQYCGSKAPDAVLVVDHIKPVAEGGDNDLLNLITACVPCNAGKGAKQITDGSAVEKKRAQLEELEQRRQTVEMMVEWRNSLAESRESLVEIIDAHIGDVSGYRMNDKGKLTARRWLRASSLDKILTAIDTSFDRHFEPDAIGRAKANRWETAFEKVSTYLKWAGKYGEHGARYAYIQAIFRNKLDEPYIRLIDDVHRIHAATNVDIESLVELAQQVEDIDEFEDRAWQHAHNAMGK